MPLYSFTSNLPILSHGSLPVFSHFSFISFILLFSGLDGIVVIPMDFSGSALSDLLLGVLLIAQAGENGATFF